MTELAYDQRALADLVRKLGLRFGDFTLASGKKAKFYLDCRKVTLDPRGANLVAAGILEVLADRLPDCIGGMAIGADPITAATVTLAGQRELDLRGFIVRKQSKGHGAGQMVEGPVEPGQKAVIVEDVVTTAGSAIQAIEQAEKFGLEIQEVVAVVDRLEGGSEALQQRGLRLTPLLTIRDLGVNP